MKHLNTNNGMHKPVMLIIILLLFSGRIFCQSTASDDSFFFIQLTDPQFGMFEKNKGFEKEIVLFKKAVTEINRLKPEFVVITGDFVHDANNQNQVNAFKQILAKTDAEIPVYLIPGNHEFGKAANDASLNKYHSVYGCDRFSFTHKKTKFIGYNSSLIKADLPAHERKQLRWLKKELRTAKKNRNQTVLFGHYPFFTDSVDEPEKYSNIPPGKRKKYLRLLKRNNVSAAFFGHFHRNVYHNYDDVELVITSAVGKQHGDDASGFRIVKIYNNKIEHKYFGFDEMPEKVIFD